MPSPPVTFAKVSTPTSARASRATRAPAAASRLVETFGAHEIRVQLDGAEVGGPHEALDVVEHDRVDSLAGAELHALHANGRRMGRRSRLEERHAVDAFGKPVQR